jgi:hypothetical protein
MFLKRIAALQVAFGLGDQLLDRAQVAGAAGDALFLRGAAGGKDKQGGEKQALHGGDSRLRCGRSSPVRPPLPNGLEAAARKAGVGETEWPKTSRRGRRGRQHGSASCATGSSPPSRDLEVRATPAGGPRPLRGHAHHPRRRRRRHDERAARRPGVREGRRELVDRAWRTGPRAQKAMAARGVPGMEADPRFWASGISLVAHMVNPHTPAVHMNTRMFWTPGAWWFGGGADLNPCIEYPEDTAHFHAEMQRACDAHDPTITPASRPGRTSISSCPTAAGRAASAASSTTT